MTEFRNFIRNHFPEYRIPEEISPGKFFRFGKNYAGWGMLFDDCSGGVVGNWRQGEKFVWQSGQSQRTPGEREQFARQLAKAKEIEDAKRKVAYFTAADDAEKRFNAATDAPNDHPYLVSKRVKSHGLKLAADGALLVPIYSVLGEMQSLQRIYPDGGKRFMPGGKVAGGCHMIGIMQADSPILICEGYATGATLFEDGNPFVVVAFNSGNLIHVAKAMREQLPDMEIIIAGDDDFMTPNNPGKTAAIEAARAIDGKVIFPEFGPDRDPRWTDFNDSLNQRKL